MLSVAPSVAGEEADLADCDSLLWPAAEEPEPPLSREPEPPLAGEPEPPLSGEPEPPQAREPEPPLAGEPAAAADHDSTCRLSADGNRVSVTGL